MANDVIKGIKGLGELLQTMAPALDGLYDFSLRIGGRTPPTIPKAGTSPRAVRRPPRTNDAREPVVDVFDEGDRLIVIAQLPGVDQDAARWSLRDARQLTIRADSFLKTLELPVAVEEQATESSFANGVLELRLWKRR